MLFQSLCALIQSRNNMRLLRKSRVDMYRYRRAIDNRPYGCKEFIGPSSVPHMPRK